MIVVSDDDTTGAIRERFVGAGGSAVYLIRPDQHVVARWDAFDPAAVADALKRASGQEV